MRDVNINRKMFSLILYITLLMIFIEVVEIIASFENRQDRVVVCLFVFCLFVCLELIVLLENFQLYGNVTITGEGLPLFFTRHSLPLNSNGSLAN